MPQGIIGLIPSSFAILIAIPLIAINGYKYYLNRNHIVFKKRYAFITNYEVIIALFNFTCYAWAYFLFWSNENSIFGDFMVFLNNTCMNLLKYCWIIRFFLLSYDLNLTNVLINYSWQSVLNPTDSNKNIKLDWYLQNKSKYNNFKWISKVLVPFLILTIFIDFMDTKLIAICLKYSHNTYQIINIVNIINILPSWIILFIIYYTIPTINDNFYISWELKYIIILIIVQLIGYSGVVLMSKIYSIKYNILSITVETVENILTKLCDVFLILISTYFVNKKVSYLIQNNKYKTKRLNINNNNDDHVYLSIDNNSDISINLIENKVSKIKHAETTIEFVKFLSVKDYFQCFADHIIKDLAINTLLAFIEIIQFQQYAQKHAIHDDNDDDDCKYDDESLFQTIKLYPGITKSQIVYQMNNDNDNIPYKLKCKAHKIFLKYIEYGSYYEVDINAEIREHVINIMMHKDDFLDEYSNNINIIIHLFEDIVNELFQIQISSFLRFKMSPQYHKCTLN